MVHKRIRNIVGDPDEIKDALKGINHKLTQEQAQNLVTLICKHKKWPLYKVKFSNRKTKRLYAYCDTEKKLIVIHNIPETVQLIIHETTHIKYDEHNTSFKRMQLRLIKLYKDKFLNLIFEEDMNVQSRKGKV